MGRNWKEENEDSAKTTFPLGKLSVTKASVTAAPDAIVLLIAALAVLSASPPLPCPSIWYHDGDSFQSVSKPCHTGLGRRCCGLPAMSSIFKRRAGLNSVLLRAGL